MVIGIRGLGRLIGALSLWPRLHRLKLWTGDFADINDELLPVHREYGDSYPHRLAALIKRCTKDLEHGDPAVRR